MLSHSICYCGAVFIPVLEVSYQFGEVHVSQHSHYSGTLAVLWVGSFGGSQRTQN